MIRDRVGLKSLERWVLRAFLKADVLSHSIAAFALLAGLAVSAIDCLPSYAQSTPAADAGRGSFNPSILPTDTTPLIFSGERGFLNRETQFNMLRRLPERLWFSATTEVSQRLETNPAFVPTGAKTNYAFRVAPSVTVGYNVLKNTGVYCNYFMIKDHFARQTLLGFPTTQSLALGVRHTKQLGPRTTLQADFQARELWQAVKLRQFDFLPSINLTHVVTPRVIVFGSTVLQMRGRNYFAAPNHELDPFYSVGMIYRKNDWNFVLSDTFVTNFRSAVFKHSIPNQGNLSMIADFEINHPISKRYLPGAVAFIRSEPVWNWRSNRVPGLSGFDYRLFGGIRFNINKPAYNSYIDTMRDKIRDYDRKLKMQNQSKSEPGNQEGNQAKYQAETQSSNSANNLASDVSTVQEPAVSSAADSLSLRPAIEPAN